jgi:hypothetical protein
MAMLSSGFVGNLKEYDSEIATEGAASATIAKALAAAKDPGAAPIASGRRLGPRGQLSYGAAAADGFAYDLAAGDPMFQAM